MSSPPKKRARLEIEPSGSRENPIEVNTEDTSIYWSDEEPDSDGIWIEESDEVEIISDSGSFDHGAEQA